MCSSITWIFQHLHMFASLLHPLGRPLHAALLDVHQVWRACSHPPAKIFRISAGCNQDRWQSAVMGGHSFYAAYVFFKSGINMQQVDHYIWVRFTHFSFLPYLLSALTTPINLSANCKQSMNWEEDVCSGTLHIQPQKARQITMSMRNAWDSRIYVTCISCISNHK